MIVGDRQEETMFLQGLNSTRCVHHNSKVLEANLPDNIHFAIFYEEYRHDLRLRLSTDQEYTDCYCQFSCRWHFSRSFCRFNLSRVSL